MLLPLEIVLCTRVFAGAPQHPSGASHFCGQQLNCALHQERWRADHAATAGYCSVHERMCGGALAVISCSALLTKKDGERIVLIPLAIVLCTSGFVACCAREHLLDRFCGQQLNCALHQERWRADHAATAGDCSVHEGICWSATASFRSKSLLRPAAELRFAPRTLAS